MDLKRITDRAKDLVDKRGGTDSVKEDAEELKQIAKGEGSLADKAKAAVAAIKDPGDDDGTAAAPPTEMAPARPAEHRGGRGRGRRGGGDGDPAV